MFTTKIRKKIEKSEIERSFFGGKKENIQWEINDAPDKKIKKVLL